LDSNFASRSAAPHDAAPWRRSTL